MSDSLTWKRKLAVLLLVLLAFACLYQSYGVDVELKMGDRFRARGAVQKIMQIKYGWASKEDMAGIATKEFMDKLDEENFYQKFQPYLLNMHPISAGEIVDEKMFVMTCRVEDFDWAYIPYFTFIRGNDGKLYISDYECDI